MLVMYSAFVLTSVRNVNYEEGTGKIFEYYVYVWTFGDFIEELISCFVSIFKDYYDNTFFDRRRGLVVERSPHIERKRNTLL